MANNKFKAAVKRAKTLYKSGRYKKFSDAVKAAYKKNKIGSRAGNDSSRGAGHTSTSTKANTTGNKTSTSTKTITAHVKIGRIKNRQTGSSNRKADRKRKAKSPGKRLSRSRRVYYERRKNRTDKPGSLTGIKSRVKQSLGKALLDYELANTIKATKEAQKRKVKYRKLLKSL